MAKSRRVTFELPPASHAILEQAAQENDINVQAAASLNSAGGAGTAGQRLGAEAPGEGRIERQGHC